MDKNLKDVLDTVIFIKERVERLPTEDRVREIVRETIKVEVPPIIRAMIVEVVPGIVAVGLKPIREQLNQIEKRIDTLEEQYANLKGVTKEIDDIRAEVRAIQQHLGIERKIAA
jgi:septation ring formation regulator EzrA